MDKVRVGVIGIGNMGSGHVNMLTNGDVPEMVLTAVADINPKRLEWTRNRCGDSVALFNTAEELMDSGLVDAVHIATPHYFHPPMVIAALERGLHVLSEKPAGVYTRQVREMNEVAKAHPELKFALMFNQRTDPVYCKLRELVQGGTLGELKRVNWIITNWYRSQYYYDSGAWRATWKGEGGGVLLNQCPHNLDLLQWICGMPSKMRAFCHNGHRRDIEVEDDVTAYFEYDNGASGVFITSVSDAPGTNRLEITLDGGKLVCEDGKIRLWKITPGEREFNATNRSDVFAQPSVEAIDIPVDGVATMHAGVIRAFAAAILRGEPLIAEGVEGIRGLMLSNAMHLSSWLDRTVALPVDEDLFYDELQKRVATSVVRETESIVADTQGTYNAQKK